MYYCNDIFFPLKFIQSFHFEPKSYISWIWKIPYHYQLNTKGLSLNSKTFMHGGRWSTMPQILEWAAVIFTRWNLKCGVAANPSHDNAGLTMKRTGMYSLAQKLISRRGPEYRYINITLVCNNSILKVLNQWIVH